MEIKYWLTSYDSRPDVGGNRYHAFELVDADTNKTVAQGLVHGDNVRLIKFGFTNPGEWDNTISFNAVEMKIRQFNALVKGWEYAGCTGEQLQAFIRGKLEALNVPVQNG